MRKNVLVSILTLFVMLSANPLYAQDMPLTPQTLQGAWSGSNGQDTLILMFMGNMCALGLNGQQMGGTWNLAGNRLTMQFQNGKMISYTVALQGNTLILDGNMRLTRQAMPGVPPASQGAPNYGGQPQGGSWGGQPNTGAPQDGSWGGQPNTGAPQGGSWGGQPNTGAPQGGSWGGQPQQGFSMPNPLEGTWSIQIPEGKRSFRFSGNRYAQLFNGQVVEEGIFSYSSDGRFQYQVTGGVHAGQRGEDRIVINGNSITVSWPDGTVITFMREGMGGQIGIPSGGWGQPSPSGNATPLEGRWIWAKNGPVSFGYVFSGNRFIFYWNGMEKSRGTFALSGMQLTMHHETGPDAGKTDNLGFQLNGNRLLIFTSQDPNIDPIPFIRQ